MNELNNLCNYGKLTRTVFLFSLLFLFSSSLLAQPNWIPGTPSVNPNPLSIDCNFGIDDIGTVYIVIYQNDYTTSLSSILVKNIAISGPAGSRVATAVIPIIGGDVNSILENTLDILNPNIIHTVFFVAENSDGLQDFPIRLNVTTLPCPSIFVETGLNNGDRCVNGDGATKTYTFTTRDGDFYPGQDAGVLKGATWTIDWGDGGGPILFHTSAYANDGPGPEIVAGWESGFLQHTYFEHEECFYVATLAIENPGACAATGSQSETRIPILHGRDLDLDGNGEFIVDEVGTGVIDTIYVCEGSEYTTSIEDISTWDCQPDIYYPSDPPGNPSGEANEEPRILQWVYGGASPDGSPEANANTITGDVVIGGLGIAANGGPGVIGDTVLTPTPILNQSAPITIPATAQEGEEFKIYYKNWNICNPFAGLEYDNANYIETEIVIKIIHAPPAPPTSDETYCEDAIGTLTASTTEGGLLTWYSDASLTTIVNTGPSLAHSETTPGVYTFYVTESVPPCEGPPSAAILTITPEITDNTLTDNNEAFCDNGDPSNIIGSAASGGDGDLSDDYQWQIRTTGAWSNIAGASNQGYNPDPISQTTSYRRVINSGECSSISNVITMEVYEPPTVDAGTAQTICSNTTATLNGSIGGGASSATWTTSGDGSFDDATDLAAAYDPGPNDISSGTVTLTLTTDDPTGPCTPVSEDVIVTVIEDVTVDAGGPGEVCSSDTYTLSGATLSGDYSTITWSTSGDGSFNNTGNLNPIYTPGPNDISNGSVQLTISVDSDAPCGDKSDNMTLTVNEQPIVSAGSSPTICEGSTYTVNNATATGDYSALTWTTSGDGSFTAGQGTLTPTYLPGPNDASAGNVTLTLNATAAGSCADNDDDMIITIEPAVDPGIIAGSQSLCFGEDAAPLTSTTPASGGVALTYQWYKAPAENGPYGVMIGENGPALDEGAMAVGSYYYFRQALSAGVCPPENTDTLSIIVNPGPPSAPLNPTNDSPVCEDGTVSVDVDDAPTAIQYIWDVSWDGTADDDDVITAVSEVFIDMTGVAPGSYTVKVKAVNGCGDSPWSVTTTITVAQVPANTSVNNTLSICSGEDTDIEFGSDIPATGTWTVTNAGSTNATGGSGLANGASIEQTLENLGTTPVTVTYNLYPIGTAPPNCVGPTESFNVTVNPIPTLTSDLTPPDICSGSAFIYTPTSATPGTSFSWERADVTGISPAGPATGTGNVNETLTNTTANPLNVEYEITLTANGCSNAQTVTVTVNPTPTLTTTLTPPAICSGSAFSYAPASATTGTTFDWDRAAVPGITPVTANSGTGNPNEILANTTANPINVVYVYTLEANGCSNTQNVTVTVNPTPTLSSDLTPPDICDGETFNYAPTSATAGTTFDWDRATVTGITPAGTTGTDDPGEALNNNTALPINVTYEYTLTANGCTNTEDVTVTVNPTPTLSSTLSPPAICSGSTFSYPPTSDTPGTSFSYTRAAVPGITPATAGSGTDNPNEILTNTTANAITVEYEYTLTADGCNNTQTVSVTVNPTPTLSSTLTPGAICDGETFNYTPTSATTGTSFSWTRAAVPGISQAAGSGTGDPDETLDNTTNLPVNVVYQYTLTASGCSNIQNVTVTVNPTPTLSSSLTPPAICNGTSFSYTPTSDTPGTTFGWSRAIVSGILPATANSGTDNPNETLTNTTANPISVAYVYTLTANGCTNTQTVNVTVNPTPELTSSLTPPDICSEETFNYTPTSATAGTSFSWTRLAAAGITPAGPTSGPGDPNETLLNTTFNPINVTYRYTLTANGCTNIQDVLVTVNPTPNATPTPLAQTIPNGDDTDILLDGDVTGTTFSWRVINAGATNASDGGPLNIGDRIQQTLSNNTAAPVTVTYRIAPSANGCPGDSVDVTVTVDPNVDMTVVNNSPNICTGDNTDIQVSSNVAGATFSWTVTDLNGLGANTGTDVGPYTGITIQDNLVNTGTETDSVIYQITPTGPAPTFIPGTTQNIKVYVYPEPQALPVNHLDSICDGTQTDIEMAADVAGSTFTWIVNDPSGTSGATSSGGSVAEGYRIRQTLDNPGNAPITVEYIITPTGPALGSCPGDPVTVEVVVDPTPVANITNIRPEICSEEFTDITMNASVANSEFTWTMADPKGTGAIDGAGLIGDKINQQLFNATQTPVNIIWEIEVNGPGTTACPGTAVFEDVTVNPLPNTTPITGVDTVCEQTPNIIFQTDVEADSYFEWNVPASLGTRIFGGSGTGSNAVVITAADIPGPGYFTDSLWVFETNEYGCTDDTIFKPLTLIPYPVPSVIAGDDFVCAYSTHTYSVPDNPGSTYQWFIPPGAGFLTDPTLNTVDVTFGLLGGQVRVTETTQGGCNTEHIIKNITVNQLPVSTLNADNTAICDGELVTFTAGPVAGVSNYEFFLNSVSQQSGTSNTWASATLANDDTITVNVTSIASCEAFAPPVIMTVNPDPVVTLTSSADANTICAGESVTFEATSGDAVIYNFFLNGVSQQSGPLYFWTTAPGAITDGDEVYVQVQNAPGCFGESDTITTTVNPVPVASIDGDHTVCPGTTVDIAVSIATGASPYIITIDNGLGSQADYLDGTPIPVTPATSTTYTLVEITDANGCTSTLGPNLTGSAVITHLDTVQILTQPKPAEVCEGIDTSFTVGSIGAGIDYEWFTSETRTGGYTPIAASNSPTLDIVAPTTALDSNYYYVVVDGTCDTEISDTVQLVIQYDPVSARDPFDAAVCEGLPAGFGVDAGATEDPVFQWYLSTDNGNTWAPLADTAVYTGTHTDSLIISSAGSRFDGYRYYAEIMGNCGGSAPSADALLTVNERPEILEQPADTTVCRGIPAEFSTDAGVTSGALYEWQVDQRDGNSWQTITGDSVGIYSGYNQPVLQLLNPETRMDQYRYRVTMSGTCTPAQTSAYATLTVNELPEITAHPQDSVICAQNNVSFTVGTGVTSSPVIQWYVDDLSGSGMQPVTEGGGYVGANAHQLQIFGADTSMNGYIYEATVSSVCGGPLVSNPATLTVKAPPEIIQQPADTTICDGEDAAFSVTVAGDNPVFEWFVDDGNTLSSIEDDGVYSGQGTSVLQITGADASYHLNRYYVRITGDCQPWVQSDIAFLYVNNLPQITAEPENDTICEYGTAKFTVGAVSGNFTYQWYESTDGVNFNPLSDVGNYIGTQQASMNIFNVDRSYDGNKYRVIVSGICTPEKRSVDVSLTVQTPPVITTPPVNVSVCDGEPAVFSIVAEGSELQYQWKVNRNDGSGFVNIPDTDFDYTGALTSTLTKLTTDAATENGYSFRVQVTGPCTPSQLTDPVILNVNSLPEIDIQPEDAAVCVGGAAQFSATASGPDLNYQWMVSTDGGNNWTALSDAGVYEGTETEQLVVNNTTAAMNGNLYRLDVSSSCAPALSDPVELTVWENPTASITGDLGSFPQLCGGELLTMDGNPVGGSGTYTTHLWSGDVLHVSPTNQRTASFQTLVKGDYNINYTVTDDNGCIGQATVVIRNFRPSAQFTSDAVPKCGDLTVKFTNQSSADAVSFDWDFDNGATSTEEDPTESFDNFDPTGMVAYYNVLMVATDAQGCKDTAQSVVTIYPKVDPEITATPTSGCQPLEVLLETKPGAAAYLWDYGDGTGENGSYTSYHMYSNLGTATDTFETVLQTTSAYGCVATDTVEIIVNPLPQPNFAASPDIQTIPESGSAPVTFTNLTANGPWTFVYDFGDGSANYTTTSFADVEHAYAAAGIYTVTLYTNVGPCIDSASTVVTINPRPPVAGFTSITEGCHPLEIAFTNTSKNADSYTWQFGDGSISRETDPVHVFYQPGVYTVKLIANGPGGTDQASVEITVNPTPQVFFNYAPDSVFVNDKPVRFFNLTSYADEYYWDFGDVSEFDGEVDSENNSTLADPLHVYMFEGWKDVLLIASNPYCVDSLFIPMAVKVIPAGELRFPNIFRPGESPVSGVNVNDLSDSERNMVFFPGVNKQVQEYRLYIYNRWGELIFESDDINTGWDGFVQGRKAAQGVYIWKVTGIYSNGSPFSDAGDVTLVWQ